MPSVDERVVKMEFDNASFERKVDSTIKSLGQLDKALKFDGAKQGFSDISSSASKFSLGGMTDAVHGVSAKFLGLATIAITALSNITNKAVDAGISIVKSLTIDQVMAGFKEYELNMNSIQTILSNTKAKGTNLNDVNKALDELNTYADKTIYNFGQMTKNIGTFTAAGIDLKTSVSSIKGISNIAAISGSSAEQASTAMYQLSQAVSSGTLKLQDWNSVVNAGMGGEVFQKALFETGKAMKTIKNVPMGQTFAQWTKAGNTFRGSLKDGWVTSEVLTNTLKGFTGEMTDAQLAAIGYSKEQIKAIQEMGKTGVDAATKVRTLTGLISTTKESIGSGWAESFRIVIGNFEEATKLFTGISTAIGKMVDKSSKARNTLLQGWKSLGGRDLLIDSLGRTIKNLGAILKPIKDAFRDVFPPATAKTLMDMTKSFSNFANMLKPSQSTIKNLHSAFQGFFSVLKIGWDIISNLVKFVGNLVSSLLGLSGPGILGVLAKVGEFFTNLQKGALSSGNIKSFFTDLTKTLGAFGDKLKDVIGHIADFFKGPGKDAISGPMERVSSRADTVKKGFDKITGLWEPFSNAMKKIGNVVAKTWDAISNFFKDLIKEMNDALGPGAFNGVLDAINTGLLGGIALLIAKWMKGGFSVDLTGGLTEKIGGVFDQLTSNLKAMEMQVKADVIMKIAEAIAILTASVVVLSMIDSAALTKALTAMAVGFGELLGAFAALSKLATGPKASLTFDMIAGGMVVLSTAILILAGAVKVLSTMSWEELARGLGAVVVLLGLVVGIAELLKGRTAGLIAAGVGITAIAIAISILGGAVKLFATMSLAELGTGLAAVAAGLAVIAGAMRLMPKGPMMFMQGAALMAIAISISILAKSMKEFAAMSWTQIGKGLAGVAGALVAIGLAMNLMPSNMILTAAGLLLVSISLIGIAKAMAALGSMSWGEIGKGLAAIAGALILLAAAMYVMQGTILGAVAITIAAAALLILVGVIKGMASIGWGDILHGLAGIAIVLAALAIAAMLISPAIPYILALGVALVVVGAGFALFGAGAMLAAQAFIMIANAGEKGAKSFVKALEIMAGAIPKFATALAKGVITFIMTIMTFIPTLIKLLVLALGKLLDGLTTLIPKIGQLIGTLITTIINLIKTKYPELIIAGLEMILAILTGIRDNIPKIVTVVGEIITGFLDAMATQLASIVQSVANLIVTLFTNVANAVGKVAGTLMFGIGIAFINGFINGLLGGQPGVAKWFASLAGKVLGWIGNVANTLKQKGIDFISGLYNGIAGTAGRVSGWFAGLAGNILRWVGNVIGTLKGKGSDLISGLYNGAAGAVGKVASLFGGLAGNILRWVGNTLGILGGAGRNIMTGLYNGITAGWNTVAGWIAGIGSRAAGAVGNLGGVLTGAGRAIMDGLLGGITQAWEKVAGTLGGLANKIKSLKGPPEKDAKLLIENGQLIMQGLQKGLESEWDTIAKWLSEVDPASELDKNIGTQMTDVINNAISDMADQLSGYEEFNPTITPVLDMTQVAKDAKQFSSLIPSGPTITPAYSYNQASAIAASALAAQQETIQPPTGAGEVKFEQNIYAPAQLSTSDIYKNTRNQITIAKQELSIP